MSWLSAVFKNSKPVAEAESDGGGYAFRMRLALPEQRNITHDGKSFV